MNNINTNIGAFVNISDRILSRKQSFSILPSSMWKSKLIEVADSISRIV